MSSSRSHFADPGTRPTRIAASGSVRAAGHTHPGLVRSVNEDRFHVDERRGLLMVVDGLGGLIRTNFNIYASDGATKLGEFNRKITILDRYVLDMSEDERRLLDRRLAVALGVMLDTGERR